jgi:hypothetical protein
MCAAPVATVRRDREVGRLECRLGQRRVLRREFRAVTGARVAFRCRLVVEWLQCPGCRLGGGLGGREDSGSVG